MYRWYKILTYLFYPFANIFLLIRKIKEKEHISRYKEKLAKIEKQRGDGYLVWFHAASVGECISILPLIQEFEINPKRLISLCRYDCGKTLKIPNPDLHQHR